MNMLLNLNFLYYLIPSILVTFYVGKICHKNGYFYVLEMFIGNVESARSTNNLLLIAYYLVNMGYVIITLQDWNFEIVGYHLILKIFERFGIILLILGILHFLNIFTLLIIKTLTYKNINL